MNRRISVNLNRPHSVQFDATTKVMRQCKYLFRNANEPGERFRPS